MSEENRPGEEFDLRGYLDLFLRRKWIIVGFTAVLCALVATGTALQPKVYQVKASILGGVKAPRLLDFDPIPEDAFRARDYLKTEEAILTSRSHIQRAVKRLIDEGFYGEVPPAQVETLSMDVARILQKRRSVQALSVPNSRMIRIAVEGEIPEQIARLANAIAEEYVAGNLEQKQQMAHQAVAWLQTKLNEAEAKLRRSQAELQDFEEEHEIKASDSAGPLSTVSFTRLNDEYMETYIQRVQLESRLEALRKERSQAPTAAPPTTRSLNDEIQAQMRQRLQKEYVDGQLELKDLSQRYGDQHPDIITLKSRQAKLERELEGLDDPETVMLPESTDVITGNLADLELEYGALVKKENLLSETMKSLRAENKEFSGTDMAYVLLKQNVDLNDKTYNDLLSKLNAARMSGELKTASVQILERAEVPEVPIEPRPVRNIVVAILLGLALGVGLVLLMEHLDRNVKNPQDAAHHLNLPLLTVVPVIAESRNASKGKGKSELVSVQQPRSHGAECYRNLRTSILFSSGRPVPGTILVTSAVAGEGKSTTAANLAVVMAQNGRKTLLIDADLRKPALQRYFMRVGKKGLIALLEGGCQTQEAVQVSGLENLDLLLCHEPAKNPSELLGSQRMLDTLVALKSRYEVIIIDSPVIISVPDAVILAARSEAVVLVHRPGAASRDMVRQARQKLAEVKANILGLVMNKVDARSASYRYAEHLYYGYGMEPETKPRRGKAKKA